MNFFQLFDDSAEQEARAGRIYGAVVGIVTNNQDPDNLGRVKVKFPWLSEVDESPWARFAAPMAGKQRGAYFLPEVGDEVLVVFEHGDVRVPYVIGALWNGQDDPPVTNTGGKNDVRMIKSRSGHVVKLNDEADNETIEIIDMKQKNRIVIDCSKDSITVTAGMDITLSAPNGTIKLDAKALDIRSSAETAMKAGTNLSVDAGGIMTIKGKTVNIN
jgi:uncharacterized protein involved in type VI secretion and phage assembly